MPAMNAKLTTLFTVPNASQGWQFGYCYPVT